MGEMDLWLCLVHPINGSRKAIFRHCPLDIPVTIGDAGEDEGRSLAVSRESWHLSARGLSYLAALICPTPQFGARDPVCTAT